MQQQDLWHETLSDAVAALVHALKDERGRSGLKIVGTMLWPSMPADAAGRKLAHCLDPERAEKLSFDELELLLRRAREQGVHDVAAWMGSALAYELRVVTVEDQRDELMRQFTSAMRVADTLARRLEGLPR